MFKRNSLSMLMYFDILVVIIIATTTCFVNSKSISEKRPTEEILQFLQRNGKTYLTLASMDQEHLEVKEIQHDLARRSKLAPKLRSRVLAINDLEATHQFNQDTLVLLVSSASKNLKKYIDIITKTKIMSCVVICIGKLRNRQFDELTTTLQMESQNSFFYWIGVEDDDLEFMDWKQIMSIKNSKMILATPLKFDAFGRIKLGKDMNGFNVNCSTLSWRPWFKLSNCKGENRTNCSGVGYLADVMNFLGRRFNFTWSCDAEPKGNWGHKRPLSGPRNATGAWGGVYGHIVNGTYPLCISVWHFFEWRRVMTDFAAISSGEKFFAAYFPSTSNYDPGLFIRPFYIDSWAVAVTISLLIMSIVFFGHWFEKRTQKREGRPTKLAGIKLTVVIGCTYSVLMLNGFYDGALTMFFAKETTAAFETESDIMEAYPNWIYNVRKNGNSIIYNRAEESKVYRNFIALKEGNPEKFTYKNVDEGIQRIKSGRIAIQAGDRTLRQYYKEHPHEIRPNTINIPQGGANFRNLLLTDNSPLLPMFQAGSVELWECGLLKALEEKWMGKTLKKQNSEPLHTVVLSLGQMMLIFSLLGGAVLVSIVILGLELFWSYITNIEIY